MAIQVLVFAVLVGLAGCAPRPAPPPRRAELGGARVAVLPFRTGAGLLVREDRAVEVEAAREASPEGEEIGAEFARRLAFELGERGFGVVDPDSVSASAARTAGRAYDSQL